MSAAVRLAVIMAGLLALANCEIQSLSQVKKVPFTACIDDSDCAGQGQDFACFQYLCYPWKDDSKLPKTDRKKTCKSNDHCDAGLECYRHPDRRNIYRGLCMEPVVDCSENGESDCPNRACCNGAYCCHSDYFSQLKELPCVSDQPCRDMGYGQFCCPNKNNATLASTCCNTDPNPPPPTTTRRPKTSAVSGAPAIMEASLSLFFVVMVTMSLRQ